MSYDDDGFRKHHPGSEESIGGIHKYQGVFVIIGPNRSHQIQGVSEYVTKRSGGIIQSLKYVFGDRSFVCVYAQFKDDDSILSAFRDLDALRAKDAFKQTTVQFHHTNFFYEYRLHGKHTREINFEITATRNIDTDSATSVSKRLESVVNKTNSNNMMIVRFRQFEIPIGESEETVTWKVSMRVMLRPRRGSDPADAGLDDAELSANNLNKKVGALVAWLSSEGFLPKVD